jgi:hypothetical protein
MPNSGFAAILFARIATIRYRIIIYSTAVLAPELNREADAFAADYK